MQVGSVVRVDNCPPLTPVTSVMPIRQNPVTASGIVSDIPVLKAVAIAIIIAMICDLHACMQPAGVLVPTALCTHQRTPTHTSTASVSDIGMYAGGGYVTT